MAGSLYPKKACLEIRVQVCIFPQSIDLRLCQDQLRVNYGKASLNRLDYGWTQREIIMVFRKTRIRNPEVKP